MPSGAPAPENPLGGTRLSALCSSVTLRTRRSRGGAHQTSDGRRSPGGGLNWRPAWTASARESLFRSNDSKASFVNASHWSKWKGGVFRSRCGRDALGAGKKVPAAGRSVIRLLRSSAAARRSRKCPHGVEHLAADFDEHRPKTGPHTTPGEWHVV